LEEYKNLNLTFLMINYAAKQDEARHRLPWKQLMERHGRTPANGNWNSFPACPTPSTRKVQASLLATAGGVALIESLVSRRDDNEPDKA
jgi:hypothetical protein